MKACITFLDRCSIQTRMHSRLRGPFLIDLINIIVLTIHYHVPQIMLQRILGHFILYRGVIRICQPSMLAVVPKIRKRNDTTTPCIRHLLFEPSLALLICATSFSNTFARNLYEEPP
jgi:hypothetical protein